MSKTNGSAVSGAVRLSDMHPGQHGMIVSLDHGDVDSLRKLLALGILPGAGVSVQQRSPSFVLRVGRTQLAVDAQIASAIRVRL